MDGLEISPKFRVFDGSQKPVSRLFATNKVGGSVHDANRLGGSSLLSRVFGRVFGDCAKAQLLQQTSASVAEASESLGVVVGPVSSALDQPATKDVKEEKVTSQVVEPSSAPTNKGNAFMMEEVMKHNKKVG